MKRYGYPQQVQSSDGFVPGARVWLYHSGGSQGTLVKSWVMRSGNIAWTIDWDSGWQADAKESSLVLL